MGVSILFFKSYLKGLTTFDSKSFSFFSLIGVLFFRFIIFLNSKIFFLMHLIKNFKFIFIAFDNFFSFILNLFIILFFPYLFFLFYLLKLIYYLLYFFFEFFFITLFSILESVSYLNHQTIISLFDFLKNV